MKKTLTTIGLALGVLFISGAVICGGLTYFGYTRILRNEAELKTSGAEFGRKTDNVGCVQESIRLLRELPEDSMADQFRKESLHYFTSSCLGTSRATNDFCRGVPNQNDERAVFGYITDRSVGNSVDDHLGAADVFREVVDFCDPPDVKHK